MIGHLGLNQSTCYLLRPSDRWPDLGVAALGANIRPISNMFPESNECTFNGGEKEENDELLDDDDDLQRILWLSSLISRRL